MLISEFWLEQLTFPNDLPVEYKKHITDHPNIKISIPTTIRRQ